MIKMTESYIWNGRDSSGCPSTCISDRNIYKVEGPAELKYIDECVVVSRKDFPHLFYRNSSKYAFVYSGFVVGYADKLGSSDEPIARCRL